MKKSVFFTIILLALSSGSTFGAVVQWDSGSGGNGNWYEAVSVDDEGGISWTTASALAAARGGTLATVTSAEENSFIFSLIQSPEFWVSDTVNNEGPWLGGYYDGANWTWVTGETWGYYLWAPGEPNNLDTEFFVNYFCYECIQDNLSNPFAPLYNDQWNNLPDTLGGAGNTDVFAYIIEWDSYPVPVPPAIWLFVSGLLGIFVTGRKSRRC